MKSDSVITYTSRGVSVEGKNGLFITFRLMLRELISSRELIWRLFVRNFSAKYRQSVLGFIWAILMPLVVVGMFVVMKRAAILTIEDMGIPYTLYALIGLTIWSLFTVGLTASANSLIEAGPMVIKINFPKISLVLAASGQAIVEFMIRSVLVAFVFFYFGIKPHWSGVLLAFICVIPIYLLMVGFGFMLSLVAGVLRDIVSVLNIALMGFMLLTPILYPIQGDNVLARVNVWNPLNYLVNVPRDLIIKGNSGMIGEFILTAVFSIIAFFLGWKLFYLAQTKIAERI